MERGVRREWIVCGCGGRSWGLREVVVLKGVGGLFGVWGWWWWGWLKWLRKGGE